MLGLTNNSKKNLFYLYNLGINALYFLTTNPLGQLIFYGAAGAVSDTTSSEDSIEGYTVRTEAMKMEFTQNVGSIKSVTGSGVFWTINGMVSKLVGVFDPSGNPVDDPESFLFGLDAYTG